jgi:hypothetical protein
MRQAGGSTHLTPLLASQQQVSQPLDESAPNARLRAPARAACFEMEALPPRPPAPSPESGSAAGAWFLVDNGGALAFLSAPSMDHKTEAVARPRELVYAAAQPPEHEGWIRTREHLWLPKQFLLPLTDHTVTPEEEADAHEAHRCVAEKAAYSGTPQSNTRPPEQHSAPELGPQYTWPDSCKPIPAGSFGNPTDPTNFTYDMSSDMAQVPEGKIAVVVVTKPDGRLLGEGESIVIDDRARATVTTQLRSPTSPDPGLRPASCLDGGSDDGLQLSARQGGGAAWGDAGTEQGYGYAVLCVRDAAIYIGNVLRKDVHSSDTMGPAVTKAVNAIGGFVGGAAGSAVGAAVVELLARMVEEFLTDYIEQNEGDWGRAPAFVAAVGVSGVVGAAAAGAGAAFLSAPVALVIGAAAVAGGLAGGVGGRAHTTFVQGWDAAEWPDYVFRDVNLPVGHLLPKPEDVNLDRAEVQRYNGRWSLWYKYMIEFRPLPLEKGTWVFTDMTDYTHKLTAVTTLRGEGLHYVYFNSENPTIRKVEYYP